MGIVNRQNRLDSSMLDSGELRKVVKFLSTKVSPALINEEGVRIDLPKPIFSTLLRVLKQMQEGKAIIMMPEEETFTSQATANYLGVSRQHLVDLLEQKEIPFHKVGTHRRVYFKDILDYERSRNGDRRQSLDKLMKDVDDAGLYDSSYQGED